MTDSNKTNRINPVTYLVFLIIAFVVIFYGTRSFSDYNMMKKAIDKVEFLEQNKAPQDEICSALNHALDISKHVQNQKQFDKLNALIKSTC